MAKPGFFENLADRWYLFWNSGVRVRVSRADGGLQAHACGRLTGVPAERLRRTVLDHQPPGPGVVDFKHDRASGWRIRGHGALADAEFLQRLRNVVVNEI